MPRRTSFYTEGRAITLPVLLLLLLFSACDDSADFPDGDSDDEQDASVVSALPENCDSITELFDADQLLERADHPCFEWLDATFGRVTAGSVGSASIWSCAGEYGQGLLVSAMHTLGVGWFGPEGNDIYAAWSDIDTVSGSLRVFLIDHETLVLNDTSRTSAMFVLFNPDIPAAENQNHFSGILPRHDYYLGLVPPALYDASNFAPQVEKPGMEPLSLYDPKQITGHPESWSDPDENELVILLGYPAALDGLAASVGRVLSDEEARSAISWLQSEGDEEGKIEYDEEAEMIIEGFASPGMSGGAVFDRDYRQAGVLVRASDKREGKQYVRAVRMSFIIEEAAADYEKLADDRKQTLAPYLDSSITSPQ